MVVNATEIAAKAKERDDCLVMRAVLRISIYLLLVARLKAKSSRVMGFCESI